MTESEITQTMKKVETEEEKEVNEEEKSEKKVLPWWKGKRAQYGLIVGVCALVIAGGAGIAIATNQPAPVEDKAQEVVSAEAVSQVETKIAMNVTAEGWDKETSTPVIAHITDAAGTFEVWTAIDANAPVEYTANAQVTQPKFDYIAPVNADGSTYRVPENPGEAPVLERVVAENVTQAEIDKVLDDIKNATAKGDATLQGEAAAALIDKVTQNFSNNPNANKEEVEKKAEETKEEAANNASASTPGGNAPSGSTSTPASGNSASGSAHTHSWTPVYKTVHHDAVTHEEPVYSHVLVESYGMCTKHHCRLYAYGSEPADWLGLCTADKNCLANTTTYERYADQQTGSKTVTDRAAYDEQVISGYTCSCGATK